MGYTASKNKLFTKIIFLVEVIILITSTLFCTVSIYRARVGIRMAIQQRMLDISNCAAGSVNGDILKTLDETTIGSPEYNDLYSRLAVFRDSVELEYVYAIKQVGEKDWPRLTRCLIRIHGVSSTVPTARYLIRKEMLPE
jgi:hypothetical protein